MIDLAKYVAPGDGLWWSQASAEPQPLVHSLLDQIGELGPCKAFCGLTWDNRLTEQAPEELSIVSYGALGQLRTLSRAGRIEVVPCHYSALPRMFAKRALPSDVGLVQVSRPDKDGQCSLGVAADYAADAVTHTPVLIAEINQRMPITQGSARIPLERFSGVVETDRPLGQAPERAPDETELAIARNVADLVEDGDTLQMGIGPLPSAVMDCLTDHQDLGFHSGMVSDGILRLFDKGVLTGSRKEIDRGTIVTGAALGSTELYDRLGELPIKFHATSYTHAPETLSRLHSLVSINSAVEVDLTGQVGSELRRGIHIGAIGGQADFSRAAALTGARSIIAVRSRSRGASTIKPTLEESVVTTARSDVDFVVTEYGAAQLSSCGLNERARRLITIAAPEHQEALERSLSEGEFDA